MINNNLYYRFIRCASDKSWFDRRSNVQLDDEEAAAGILKDGLIMIDTDRDRDSELLLILLDILGVKCNIVRTLGGIQKAKVKSNSKMETVTGIIVDVNRQKSDLDIVKRYGVDNAELCSMLERLLVGKWKLGIVMQ